MLGVLAAALLVVPMMTTKRIASQMHFLNTCYELVLAGLVVIAAAAALLVVMIAFHNSSLRKEVVPTNGKSAQKVDKCNIIIMHVVNESVVIRSYALIIAWRKWETVGATLA